MNEDIIWILTEEKPKSSVIDKIIETYCENFDDAICQKSETKIKPIFENGVFTFQYYVDGIHLANSAGIRILLVSGNSSFVDFLIFKQKDKPSERSSDIPIMAIEETKTCDSESRNTGVYQRGTKFIFIRHFYPDVKLYMLYNDENIEAKMKKPSPTSVFGTNLLLTIGVNIIGKDLKWFRKFNNIDEILESKAKMRDPAKGNRVVISRDSDDIRISCRLDKKNWVGKIAHDPNIGMVTILAKCFRDLGWSRKITVTNHNVMQMNILRSRNNKFLHVCSLLSISLDGINLPEDSKMPKSYWHYEKSSEKVASILLHVQCECGGLKEIYQNHAGCERGYFIGSDGKTKTLPKKDRTGNNLFIPDLVMYDEDSKVVILIEGKKISTLQDGIKEIKNYDSIETEYICKEFPEYSIVRGVSIFGGNEKEIPDEKVMFYLSSDGHILVNSNAPTCVKHLFNGNVNSM